MYIYIYIYIGALPVLGGARWRNRDTILSSSCCFNNSAYLFRMLRSSLQLLKCTLTRKHIYISMLTTQLIDLFDNTTGARMVINYYKGIPLTLAAMKSLLSYQTLPFRGRDRVPISFPSASRQLFLLLVFATSKSLYIYIYIEREREIDTYIYTCIYMCIYIYIHI